MENILKKFKKVAFYGKIPNITDGYIITIRQGDNIFYKTYTLKYYYRKDKPIEKLINEIIEIECNYMLIGELYINENKRGGVIFENNEIKRILKNKFKK